MAFSYGSDALNQLAQGVDREPADLSTKADVSALNTTNATVATKQTLGEPTQQNVQFVTTDATVDPDFPVWAIIADGNSVTLTLPPIANVTNRQFLILGADIGGNDTATVRVDPTTTDVINSAGVVGTSIQVPVTGYAVLLLAVNPGSPPSAWLATSITDPRVGTVATGLATPEDKTTTLPPAAISRGIVYAYRNTGTGGFTLTVNRAGGDTINGGTAGVVLADGKSACFVRDQGTPTNWIVVATIA